jgi:peptidoglycan/xylan/chitin deacetylase (PgdA/CDA1 family)
MVEVEMRENNVELAGAVEEAGVSEQAAGAGPHVQKQRPAAVADQDAARLASGRRHSAAAPENRHTHSSTLHSSCRGKLFSGLARRAVVVLLVGAVGPVAFCVEAPLARVPRNPPGAGLQLPSPLPNRSLRLPILLYHRVDRSLSTLSPITQRLTVDPRDFAAQMSWVKRHGFHALTQPQLFAGLEEGTPLPCRPLLVTFDDGYLDVLNNAAPVLRRLGMPATMYVITDRPPLRNSGFLSWRGVVELERQGFDIGSHTVTHRLLTTLSDQEVVDELVRSREELARHLGHPVQWLAYPHGAVDARVVKLARRAGYVLGVTSSPGIVQDARDPLELHRFEILDSTGVRGLAAILRPAGVSCPARSSLIENVSRHPDSKVGKPC